LYVSIEKRRIRLYIQEHRPDVIERLKGTPGARFVHSSSRGSAHWTLPLSIRVARQIKAWADGTLEGTDEFASWWVEATQRERQLRSLGSSSTAELWRLPVALPDLYRAIHAGPIGRGRSREELDDIWMAEDASYQAADVAYATLAGNYLNGLKPGLGKTLEHIASVFEAGIEQGKHLVIAPAGALETVWMDELERWQPLPVFVCVGTAVERRKVIESFTEVDAGWLLINPEMARMIEDIEKCPTHILKSTKVQIRNCSKCSIDKHPPYPELMAIRFVSVVVDECHKTALSNPKSLTAQGISLISSDRRCALSGTPMGGKSINLWGVLHWLDPVEYSSKWTWSEEWLEINEGFKGKKLIGELRDDQEEEFYKAHSHIILRRTKEDVLPWLPPKQLVPVWCQMGSAQRKQYEKWDLDAEIRIADKLISGSSILDEYTRKMQFAFSRLTSDLKPTLDSCKLVALRQDLDELGIYDRYCDEQVVIFSQFTEVVSLVAKWLADDGVSVDTITGNVTGFVKGMRDEQNRKVSKRAHLGRQFQSGGIRVLVMNTKAGGVSINLDNANTACFLDETWNPDDTEQAEDRIHRSSRIHQVTCRYYRTIGTIDEDVVTGNIDKRAVNDKVLDRIRRKYLK
jgi:SNF2 family DNA or RNA helicase